MSQPSSIRAPAPQPAEVADQARLVQGKPRLIFSVGLDGVALQGLLMEHGLLEEIALQQHGVALAMLDLSDAQAAAVRQLHAWGIYTIAWLLLPTEEGTWLNLQNYPQAIERYRLFRDWATEQQLHFHAVGLDIGPPASEIGTIQHWRYRDIARRLWLARENVLYPAARAAYADLVDEIHRDGYEVHTFQLPVIADDQRAGTTLVQRALDIVDLHTDLEVLMCFSSLPIDILRGDLAGALITSYGPSADSIGVGNTDAFLDVSMTTPAMLWETLERDLLLAASYTDTIYIFSLEGCVQRGLLPRIASIDWSCEPQVPVRQRMLVKTLRTVLLVVLLLARFYRVLFAWLGWLVAAALLVQQWRQRRALQRADTNQQAMDRER